MNININSITNAIIFVAFLLLLCHMIYRIFRYFVFVAKQDKTEWKKNKKFRAYYFELAKLQKKETSVNIDEAESYLIRKTVKRKIWFCIELFLLGASILLVDAYKVITVSNEFLEPLHLLGPFLEIAGVLSFAKSLHGAVTPIELSKDLQESEKIKSEQTKQVVDNSKELEIVFYDKLDFDIKKEGYKKILADAQKPPIFSIIIVATLFIVSIISLIFAIVASWLLLVGFIVPLFFGIIFASLVIDEIKRKKDIKTSSINDYEIKKVKCINKWTGEVDIGDKIENAFKIISEETDYRISENAYNSLNISDELNLIIYKGKEMNLAYVYSSPNT